MKSETASNPWGEKRLDQGAIARRLLTPTDPQLRNLARRRPRRVWADGGRCYGLILAAFVLLASSDTWWVGLASFALIGTQQYSLFILGHDGMHANLFRRRTINDLFTTVFLYSPLGMFLPDQRTNHLAHHERLGEDEDPDRYLHAASNKDTHSKFLVFLAGLKTFPRTLFKVSPFSNHSVSRFVQVRRLLTTRWTSLLAQAMIFTAILLYFPWWYYFLFWVLPIYVLVFLPDEIRAFCEHAQPVLPDQAGDQARLVTFRSNFWERQLLAPLNMNFHAEHHLWPSIPYYNLPALNRLVGNCPEILIRQSYVGFLWSYFRQLPLETPRSPFPTGV